MPKIRELEVGAVFRRPNGKRRWRLLRHRGELVYAVAEALDKPERYDRKSALPGGTNEVAKGQRDYWSENCEVEVVE